MKFEDIKNLKLEELENKSEELKKDLFQIKMKNALGQLANPLEIRMLRKDIARYETAMRQKR